MQAILLSRLDTFDAELGDVNTVIETPKGSPNSTTTTINAQLSDSRE